MALTRDFKVKDSLTVGISGLFKAGETTSYNSTKVAIDTYGKILSGGRDLSTVFANITLANLTNGAGINTFLYNGGSAVTVSVSGASSLTNGSLVQWSGTGFANSTLTDAAITSLRTTTNSLSDKWNSSYSTTSSLSDKWNSSYTTTNSLSDRLNSTYTSVCATSASWNSAYLKSESVYAGYGATSGTTIDDVTIGATQGSFNVVELDGGSVTRNLTNLGTNGSPTFATLSVTAGVSAATFTGDGSALTNVTATAIFPAASVSDLVGATKIFVNDGANKHITFTNFLADLFGEGLAVSGEKLIIKNAAALVNNTITYWDDSNGQLVNSTLTQNGTVLSASGGLGVVGAVVVDGALIAKGSVNLPNATSNTSFVIGGDTNLYRSAADTLRTDDSLIVGVNLTVNGDITLGDAATDTLTINAGPVNLPNATTAADAIVLGGDVTLYRDGANVLRTNDSLVVDGNTTIAGNLTVQGTTTQLDTLVSVTSALSVINTGTGPAFYAEQAGVGRPIAQFVDRDGGSITFSDLGSIGIGTPAGAIPNEKLTVVGSISASGTLKLNGLVAGTTNSVVIESGGTLQDREINSGVWSTTAQLISGFGTRTTNTISKFTDQNGIANSTITDNGTDVTIGGNVVLTPTHRIKQYAESGDQSFFINTAVFSQTLTAGLNTVETFLKADLKTSKYCVTLFTGTQRTAFEILAVYDGTDGFGTVYAIIDAQATSLLTNVDIAVGATTIDLAITPAIACSAFIKGESFVDENI